MIRKDLSVFLIRDVRTLVQETYDTFVKFHFYNETRSIKSTLEFERKLDKFGEPNDVKIIAYPKSREVKLWSWSDNAIYSIVVQISTNKHLYFLLDNFRTAQVGYRSNNKFDRYKNLYIVYEELEKNNKEYKYTAIRHAISHPRLTTKVENEIKSLFGEDKIDLGKRKHTKILQSYHEELLKKTEKLLISFLINQANLTTKIVGHYVII